MTTTLLVIDTQNYAGNFEREMTGWIVGNDNYGEMYDRGSSEKSREEHPELSEYFAEWQTNHMSDYMFDEEYGRQLCGIYETPGWSNNGMGVHTRLAEGEKRKYPAYNSVAIALNDTLPTKVLNTAKQLAHEYANANNITIDGFRYVTIRTTVETRELTI